MPVLVKLDDVPYARRTTLTELSETVGITLANLPILKTEKARAIHFSTLEAASSALHCRPGDQLEFNSRSPTDDASSSGPNGAVRTCEVDTTTSRERNS